MKDILVWYRRGNMTGSMHVTVQNDSIAYTIAEFESRNTDTVITNYLNSDNQIVTI